MKRRRTMTSRIDVAGMILLRQQLLQRPLRLTADGDVRIVFRQRFESLYHLVMLEKLPQFVIVAMDVVEGIEEDVGDPEVGDTESGQSVRNSRGWPSVRRPDLRFSREFRTFFPDSVSPRDGVEVVQKQFWNDLRKFYPRTHKELQGTD